MDANGPKMDKLRKNIIELFKNEGLSITIDTNLVETDFLDVSFNIITKTYQPYRKPGNDPLYVNTNSNHPSSILKAIPEMINQRISETSCNEQVFNNTKAVYETALLASGFKHQMLYKPTNQQQRNRPRKIVWFNPPFSQHVKTNIGNAFLKIVKKHFVKDHKYYKIFNQNTLKLSYSCMTNVQNIIKGHNSKVLNAENKKEQRACNCRKKEQCPMNGDCLSIYKAEVNHSNITQTYYGQCEGEFKSRYNNHTSYFRNIKHRNDTELSKLIWQLKEESKEHTINWSIAARATPYKNGSKSCDLCLTEKVTIVRAPAKGLLNKRTELVSKCRHRNKFSLKSLKT